MAGEGDPRRILIVDDNLALAENIAEILQLDGHTTEVATSAEEALARFSKSDPDFVVTDYRLPGINGADLVRQVRQARAGARVVVMSAYTDERTISDAQSSGATFIAKPVDYAFLVRLVREGSA